MLTLKFCSIGGSDGRRSVPSESGMNHSRCTGLEGTRFRSTVSILSSLCSANGRNLGVPFNGPRRPDVDTKAEVSISSFEFCQIRNFSTHPRDMSTPVMNVDTSEDLVSCPAMRQLQDVQAERRYDFKAGNSL